jgi:DNA primase
MSHEICDYDFSRYLKVVHRNGTNVSARCPFHDDKSPSFSGNTEKGLWKCWGCGEAGNWWQLLAKLGVISKNAIKTNKGKTK